MRIDSQSDSQQDEKVEEPEGDVRRTQSLWNFGAKYAEKFMKEKGKVENFELVLDETIDLIKI